MNFVDSSGTARSLEGSSRPGRFLVSEPDQIWHPFVGFHLLPPVVRQVILGLQKSYRVFPVESQLSYKNKGQTQYASSGYSLSTRLEFVRDVVPDELAVPPELLWTFKGLSQLALGGLYTFMPNAFSWVGIQDQADMEAWQAILAQDRALYQAGTVEESPVVFRFTAFSMRPGPGASPYRLNGSAESVYLSAISKLYEIGSSPEPGSPDHQEAELSEALFRLSMFCVKVILSNFTVEAVDETEY